MTDEPSIQKTGVRCDSGARLQARKQNRRRAPPDTRKRNCLEGGQRLGTSLCVFGDGRAILPEKEGAPVQTVEQLVLAVHRTLSRRLNIRNELLLRDFRKLGADVLGGRLDGIEPWKHGPRIELNVRQLRKKI